MRIHERYYFYVLPLFVIALVATLAIPRSDALVRAALAAAAAGTVLLTVIPFGTVINHTVGIDSFGLSIFLKTRKHGVSGPVHHALLLAMLVAFCLGALYALARPKPVLVLATLALFCGWVSLTERADQANAATLAAQKSFSSARNWVDRADGGQDVPLIENPRFVQGGLEVSETSFFNLTVSRLYYLCDALLFPQFNEQQIAIAADGRLLTGGKPIGATYAVVPSGHGIEGRVVARDIPARLVLVQPAGEILRVAPGDRKRWACASR